MKHFNLTKLLLGGVLLLSLSACNKEPADIAKMPSDYDLKSAINELPAESKVNAKTDTSSAKGQEEAVLEAAPIKPSESFACLGVNDQLITNYRAGLFVPGSLPIADWFDSSLMSNVEFIKNDDYFDILFNYYKNGNKLIAQYECPRAIKGTSFLDHVNDNTYKKKCFIEEKAGKYVTSSDCKPRFYCQGPDVKLNIFEHFLDDNSSTNKIIKTFKIKDNNSCQKARKLYESAGAGNIDKVKKLLYETDINIATSLKPKGSPWEPELISALDRPVLNAINNNHNKIVKLLLENGANPNLSNLENSHNYFEDDNDTWDALGWAITKNNKEIIDWILPKIKSKKDSLLIAACYGNNEVVKAILAEDTSTINEVGAVGWTAFTPLSCALSVRNYPQKYTPEHREVVKTLVEYGANVNQEDPSGWRGLFCLTPLQLAVYKNDFEIVKFLIDKGADINLKNDKNNNCPSALEIAKKEGNAAIIEFLKSYGAKETVSDYVVDPPKISTEAQIKQKLIVSSEKNELEKVKEVLGEAEEYISIYDDTTALIWAVKEGHTQVVKALLAVGVKVDEYLDSDDTGSTALMWAARKGHTDMVKLLLAAGANVNKPSSYTGSAIAGAARNGHTEIVKLLLAAGADVNQVDEVNGDSALMQAAEQGCSKSVKLLLEAGANVNITDNEGRTALLRATRPYSPDSEIQGCEDKMDVIKELISAGANVNVVSKEGQSPLFYAVYTGNTEVVKLLLAAGADVNIKFDGETVLQRAQEEEYTEIVKLLKAAGAKE